MQLDFRSRIMDPTPSGLRNPTPPKNLRLRNPGNNQLHANGAKLQTRNDFSFTEQKFQKTVLAHQRKMVNHSAKRLVNAMTKRLYRKRQIENFTASKTYCGHVRLTSSFPSHFMGSSRVCGILDTRVKLRKT